MVSEVADLPGHAAASRVVTETTGQCRSAVNSTLSCAHKDDVKGERCRSGSMVAHKPAERGAAGLCACACVSFKKMLSHGRAAAAAAAAAAG